MKKIVSFPALIIALFMVSGCGIYMSIYTDYDRSVNFQRYKTFSWLVDKDTSNSEVDNHIIRNNIRNYFNYELARRAYQIDVDSPDIFLDLIIRSDKKTAEYTNSVYAPYPGWYRCNPYYQECPPYYYYRYPYNYNYSVVFVTQQIDYWESSITLNIIDRKENKLVWTGTARGNIYDPACIQENLHPAVYRILKKYPVKPIQKLTS